MSTNDQMIQSIVVPPIVVPPISKVTQNRMVQSYEIRPARFTHSFEKITQRPSPLKKIMSLILENNSEEIAIFIIFRK